MKLWQGDAFTPVCQSFCSQGRRPPRQRPKTETPRQTLQDRDPQTETPLYRDLPGQRPPWTETPGTETPRQRPPETPWTETPWTEIPQTETPRTETPDRDPWTETPFGQRPPWTETPLDRDPLWYPSYWNAFLLFVQPGFEFNLILLVVLGRNNYWEVLFLATFIRNFSTN